MRTQRVFILSPHTLLVRGMQRLLRGRRALRIVGTETDPERGIQMIHALHPDVVILGGEIGEPSALIMVSAVFEASPGTAVISLSVGNNLLHIYKDNRMEVAKLEDLIQAIKQAGVNRPRGEERATSSERR